MSERLSESLLRGRPGLVDRRPSSPWAYSLWGILVVSVFVFYHVAVLLVWNSPGVSLAKDFHDSFLKQVKGHEYFRGSNNTQGWDMFAPNPTRTNAFVHVFVTDQEGVLWDFEQDIWENDRYPYWFYDRRGKINRRIDGKKHFQRIYGAWVCREWERINDGEPAVSVKFVRRWTTVPDPAEVIAKGGWNQWEAPFKQIEQETITCKTATHGQLPNQLRERYGLETIDEDKEFRAVREKTWWNVQESERVKAEKAEQREAARAAKAAAKPAAKR